MTADKSWRPVEIMTVLGDDVTVRYLDMVGAPALAQVKIISRRQMLTSGTHYRLRRLQGRGSTVRIIDL